MLTIEEVFDICKEHDVLMDLSYIMGYADGFSYMIKLYYHRQRQYRLLNSLDLKFLFGDRESFEKYVCDFLEEAKKKEEKE